MPHWPDRGSGTLRLGVGMLKTSTGSCLLSHQGGQSSSSDRSWPEHSRVGGPLRQSRKEGLCPGPEIEGEVGSTHTLPWALRHQTTICVLCFWSLFCHWLVCLSVHRYHIVLQLYKQSSSFGICGVFFNTVFSIIGL